MLTFTILCVSFFLSFLHVRGSPLVLRDVFNPHITSPSNDTVWVVGTKETVTWQTSDIPPNLTNPNGTILLGYVEPNVASLHLQVDTPLAQNFKLTDGQVQITVPNVPPQNNYIIVLMGDSGNTSPLFSISDNRPQQSGSSATLPTTLNSSPIPITGTTITGGATTLGTGTTTMTGPESPSTATMSSPVSTPTSLPVSTSTSLSSTDSTLTTSLAAGSSPSNNSASTSSRADSMRIFTVGVVSLVLLLIA